MFRLQQILMNLINNALKFTTKGGVIESKVYLEDNSSPLHIGKWKIGFSVADDGIGIPISEASKLFEPFFQVRTEHTAKGSGLGNDFLLPKLI
jgi:signal transduction histidine kinase